MISDEIMDELYNSTHILIQKIVALGNHLQYFPKYDIYLLLTYLETKYIQPPYFHNVIVIMEFEHGKFNIILNTFQDRNHVYPYSANPGISLSGIRGCKIKFRVGGS